MIKTAEVFLTNGQSMLLDSEIADRFADRKFIGMNSRGKVYAQIWNKENQTYNSLSRIIIDAPKGLVVDHINGNTLDNRRENLRICTRAENNRNAKHVDYKGTQYFKQRNKWRAYIKVDKCFKSLGYFSTQQEAAVAYNEAALKYFGEFACLNVLPLQQSA